MVKLVLRNCLCNLDILLFLRVLFEHQIVD